MVCLPCYVAPVADDAVPLPFDPLRPGQEAIGDLAIVGKHPREGRSAKTGMPRPLPSPKMPSQLEIDLHNLTHAKYAVWCPYCVSGKRANNHHRRSRVASKLPLLSADYAYFGDGDLVTILVMHVKPYGVMFACVADGKGPTPNMVRMVAEWIKL